MRMHSQNGPNNWMIESSWTGMTKAERLFLSKGDYLPSFVTGNWTVHQWSVGPLEVPVPSAEWQRLESGW